MEGISEMMSCGKEVAGSEGRVERGASREGEEEEEEEEEEDDDDDDDEGEEEENVGWCVQRRRASSQARTQSRRKWGLCLS